MSPRAGRALAGIAAGMLAVLLAAGALAAATAASAVTADESGLPLEVLITEVSPQVLGVGQDLTLRVQVDQHPRLRDGARPGVAHLDPQGQVLADPEHP